MKTEIYYQTFNLTNKIIDQPPALSRSGALATPLVIRHMIPQ